MIDQVQCTLLVSMKAERMAKTMVAKKGMGMMVY